MSGHTEGPWTAVGDGSEDQPPHVIRDDGHMIADCSIVGLNAPSPDESAANARLIAAAPDLLAALERLIAPCAHWPDSDLKRGNVELGFSNGDPVLAARAAIAKAKGGAP